MSRSRFDQFYRKLLLTKFFTKGWGKPDNLKRIFDFRKIMSNRETCKHLVSYNHPIYIDKEYKDKDCRILEGHFLSPFVEHMPGIMPKEVETATFQIVLPVKWKHPTLKPVCIHLAGTGDHFFWRRRMLTARPLLKEAGIGSILLENPYYGSRKPKEQLRSSLQNVSDLFVMGGALILESTALLNWCEREGYGPLGLAGTSMGGHMASLAATAWDKPISLIPCLSWSTASCTFTEGVMSGAIPWHRLQEQFFENSVYQSEIRKLIVSPEDEVFAYQMGQEFIKNYSDNIDEVQKIHNNFLYVTKETHERVFKTIEKPEVPKQKVNSVFNINRPAVEPDSIIGIDSLKSDVQNFGTDSSLDSIYFQNERKENKSETNCSNSEDFKFISADEYIESINNSKFTQGKLKSLANENVNDSTMHKKQLGFSSVEVLLQSNPTNIKESTIKSPNININKIVSSKNNAKLRSRTFVPVKNLFSKSKSKSLNKTDSRKMEEEKIKSLQKESLNFMRGVMDECTHLGNYSVPVDPELIIIVSAKRDAYILTEGVLGLDRLWPGCEVRHINNGHVSAVLFNQAVFRKAMVDSFDRQVKKYYPGHQGICSEDMKKKS